MVSVEIEVKKKKHQELLRGNEMESVLDLPLGILEGITHVTDR